MPEVWGDSGYFPRGEWLPENNVGNKITRAFIVVYTDENIALLGSEDIQRALRDALPVPMETTIVAECPPISYDGRR